MVELGERQGFFMGDGMRQGGGMMQLPSGAHRGLLPLTLPLLLSSVSTHLFPVHVLSPQASTPLSSKYWLVAMTIAPGRKKENGVKMNYQIEAAKVGTYY